eukprot:6898154-Prymnesium_polylepis.1
MPEAKVLVIPNGVQSLLEGAPASAMLAEVKAMPKDKTSLMYGRVVNKHARHNNCMGDYTQRPDIANGKGTVVNLHDYPITKALRDKLATSLCTGTLVGELNHYFDSAKCGIGWHGDAERKIVA